ncbi:MAG: patatin-like phospholipase family protein [Oceanospirillaceae bacterium]|nr:patatin-like phospholipase family protein [Oceanospirillaceae bacterium]
MNEPMKVGLVLSGGGAKGAYQVGVMKALVELGAQVDMVAGASIGALNGAIVASAPSLPEAAQRLEALWLHLAESTPLKANTAYYLRLLAVSGLKLYGRGALTVLFTVIDEIARRREIQLPDTEALLDDKPLRELMDEYLDITALKSGLPFYVSVYESRGATLDLLRAIAAEVGLKDTPDSEFIHLQSQNDELAREYLLSSAAIPFLFSPGQIGGKRYSDGGQGSWQTVQGNTPITPLLEAGCNMVIVTHLSDGSIWSRHKYKNATILEIRPQSTLNRAKGIASGARDLLGFDAEKIHSWIEQGYEDTLATVQPIMGASLARDSLRIAEDSLQATAGDALAADAALEKAMGRLK